MIQALCKPVYPWERVSEIRSIKETTRDMLGGWSGQPGIYLASHEIDAERLSLFLFFPFFFGWVTFSPMRGSTSLMTGLVFLAKARILARSVRILTGTKRAVATIAQFQKAASHMTSFQSRNVYLSSETSCLHWKSELRNVWGQ